MSPDASEPGLTVRHPVPWFLRRRFLRSFTPVASLAVVGLVALFMSANLGLPFEKLVTFHGSMGAQSHYFEDGRVRELLLRHHIRVNVIRQGSIAAVTGDLGSLDFVFPSGQSAAEILVERRRTAGEYYSVKRPFVSHLVLATYRDYAETLRGAGVATPQDTPGFDRPYYYNLDMTGFLDLVAAKKSWDDLNGRAHGVINGNPVLAQTTDVCGSNGSSTYVGLVSYVAHGRAPTTEEEAAGFATKIKPLLDQGLAPPTPEIYFLEDGRLIAPIIVLYEHQYLAYQLHRRELDGDRVLLYPNAAVKTQPLFVALNRDADQLGRLLDTDPELRGRALELGLQVLDPTRDASSDQLSMFLAKRHVPVPSPGSDTRAVLPKVPQLRKMLSVFCPSVMPG
ncbi:MAG: hypothetical protein ACRDRX_25975 [Pseudonocardiaceae bacterium]